MRSFALCLVLILPLLSGCKGELAAVKIHLAPDGSGECDVGGVREVQYAEGDAANGESEIQNAGEVRSVELKVRQMRAKFASIDALKIGDISFATAMEDGMKVLTVRIPAGAGSKWFTAHGVTERSLDQWKSLDEATRVANASRKKADPRAANLEFEMPRPPNVLFEINLPTKLAGQGIETVPLGLTTKVSTDHGQKQATLSIPLAEIHANKLKEVVWKIRYAPE